MDLGCPQSKWEKAYNLLLDYNKEFGNTRVPNRLIYKNFALGRWVAGQRRRIKSNNL